MSLEFRIGFELNLKTSDWLIFHTYRIIQYDRTRANSIDGTKSRRFKTIGEPEFYCAQMTITQREIIHYFLKNNSPLMLEFNTLHFGKSFIIRISQVTAKAAFVV